MIPLRSKKGFKKLKSVLNYISTILMWSILSILILIGIIFLVYLSDVKNSDGKGAKPMFSAYIIISGSMEPKIKVYDIVVSGKTDETKLKVGDVITFRSLDPRYPNSIITHRIVEVVDKSKGEYRTMGDANNTVDEHLTTKESIMGKVVFKVPQLGRIQTFIATKGGWLICVLIPCLSIISYDIVKLLKLVKKKVKRRYKSENYKKNKFKNI